MPLHSFSSLGFHKSVVFGLWPPKSRECGTRLEVSWRSCLVARGTSMILRLSKSVRIADAISWRKISPVYDQYVAQCSFAPEGLNRRTVKDASLMGQP